MTSTRTDTAPRFPVDVTTITGIRIEGTPDVIPVDSGSATIVAAGGETWLHWEHNGLHRAVNNRHIVEVFSNSLPPRLTDLTSPTNDFSRLKAARAAESR